MHSLDRLQKEPSYQQEELKDVARNILEECRMVLPGVQALFGFQLIAVFNASFQQRLTHAEQIVHLAAILMVAAAVALVMAPAAYHRQVLPEGVSRGFAKKASRFLYAGMAPLMTGSCLDIYLIARMITDHRWASFGIALAAFLAFAWTWYGYPQLESRRRARREAWERQAGVGASGARGA